MKRLVIISNRVPPGRGRQKAPGGLVTALISAFDARHGLWFGWSGEVADAQTTEVVTRERPGYTLATIDLSRENHEEYYNGFANRTLWPLCHYRTDLVAYDRSYGVGYNRVNTLMAQAIQPLLQSDDLIWVHDYHLIPFGAALRDLGVTQRLGFFLHIPWPAAELLLTLPEHRALVKAMFAYDVIGFQTERDVWAFMDYVMHETGGVVHGPNRVTCYGRTVRVEAFPIGIDAAAVAEAAQQPEADRHVSRMIESLNGRQLIIGVDRLDYSKGIEQRIGAYGKLLERAPHLRSKVSMLQIAPPSRISVSAYQAMRRQLELQLGHINGQYADYDWVPLRYVNRSYGIGTLAGLFRCARVAMVTPLRDGMNLVAKEFVAAQDPDDPGVLVLSRFAGAASQLKEALIVNPYDQESMVEALQQALDMPLGERQRRWRVLMDNVSNHGIAQWLESFLAALSDQTSTPPAATLLTRNVAAR